MDRRRFLLASAAAAALPSLGTIAQTSIRAGTPPVTPSAGKAVSATLKLHPGGAGPRIPGNFIGLSYETNELVDPSFFSPRNTGLIEQFRSLSPHGVLRIGGNTSDVGYWKPTPAAKPPMASARKVQFGEPSSNLSFPITPEAIQNLHGFLQATGWTCIYGINLGSNTPRHAADEATYVAQVLGLTQQHGKLEYFQLGNEPDLFGRRLRDPKTWSPELYMDQWLAEADAIRAVLPAARFGLPDTGGNPGWYAAVVNRLLSLSDPPQVAALTHHYYIGGPPSNPAMNIDFILAPNPRVAELAKDIAAAAARLSSAKNAAVPYRMTEGNTCYRGGKPGVSDVYAAALWAADYLLDLACRGYAGANLHGGTGKYVGNSLGGHLPGDDLLQPSAAALHPHPFYTPIARIGDQFVAEPVAYGMLFAAHFAGTTAFPVDFNPGSVNATAYAATLPTGQHLVAIINKDRARALAIDLPFYRQGPTLTAPSLSSSHVQIQTPSTNQQLSTVPPSTAVLLYASRSEPSPSVSKPTKRSAE
ncbi:MAG: hypothetical protein ACLGQX_00550 [Acidobacteriota bacterium]